jgi:hypothetical protein
MSDEPQSLEAVGALTVLEAMVEQRRQSRPPPPPEDVKHCVDDANDDAR